MTARPPSNPAAGLLRAAVGRADAVACFGGTVPHFLNSLAPLIAFPIAAALLELMENEALLAVAMVLLAIVVQLAPPVFSHALARFWGLEAPWLRYATAYNWCHWLLPVVGFALSLGMSPVVAGGLAPTVAAEVVLGGIALYGLWLHWTLARHGLGLGRGRAALFVLVVDGLTAAVAIGPAYLSNGSGS